MIITKPRLAALVFSGLACSVSQAATANKPQPNRDGLYVRGFAGVGIDRLGSRLHDAFDFGAGLGFKHKHLRVEGELRKTRFDFDGTEVLPKFHTDTYSATANVLWDFDNATAFTPFVGVGLGVGYSESSWPGLESHSDRYSLIGSAIVGVDYAFNDKLSADLRYRVPNLLSGSSSDLHQSLDLGLSYRFG